MNGYEQQFKKGILELLVLKIISTEQIHGYDLIVQLRQQTDGLFTVKEGTLYPLLHRMEDGNLIYSQMADTSKDRRGKKFYCITPAGKATLSQMANYWNLFCSQVQKILSLGGQTNEQ